MDNDLGILVHNDDMYDFYVDSSMDIDTYYLAVPKKKSKEYSLYLDIPDKDLRYLDKNYALLELINTINSSNQKEKIYLFPVLPKELIFSKDNMNDDIINHELEKRLIRLISEVFDKFIKNNVSLEQCAYLIIANEFENNFLDWIKLNSKYANLIRGYNLGYQKELFLEFNNDNIHEEINDDNGGNALSGNLEEVDHSMSKPKVKVKKLPSKVAGFSNITFIVTIIILSLVIGIYLAK